MASKRDTAKWVAGHHFGIYQDGAAACAVCNGPWPCQPALLAQMVLGEEVEDR